MRVCCRLTGLDAPRWWRDARRARGEPCLQSSVRSVSRSVCHVLSSAVMYREALYWRLDLPSGRESGQRLVISTPLLVAPAARQQGTAVGRTRDLVFVLRNACLPVYLADLTIMNGHGAHRRQEGSQLAAEPACSRRVRAPSETWGDGCSRQVGEATTRRVTWAWGGPYGPSWLPLGRCPDTSMPTPPAAHQLDRADKHETVTREGIGITFL